MLTEYSCTSRSQVQFTVMQQHSLVLPFVGGGQTNRVTRPGQAWMASQLQLD